MDDYDSQEFTESLSTEEVNSCLENLKATLGGTSDSGEVFRLGTCSWKPDFLTADGKLVHVQRTLRLPSYAKKRLLESQEKGIESILVIPSVFLHVEALIRFITAHDILVSVVDEEWNCSTPAGALDVVAREVTLPAELRTKIASNALALCLEANTNALKGKRLESLLSFLLSQVDDLEIHSTNLRTKTEELDVVVRTRGVGRRSWQLQGANFIIVEAKNWSSKVGQSIVSTLLTKLMGKRGNCRIGILVGLGGFTSDAEMQEIRFAGHGDITICFIDRVKLKGWIEAADFDAFFEGMIETAMLR